MYEYQCSACEHAFERTLKISDMRVPEGEPCPSCAAEGSVQKRMFTAPGIGDPVQLGVRKPDGAFREVLQKVHERVPKSNLHLKF